MGEGPSRNSRSSWQLLRWYAWPASVVVFWPIWNRRESEYLDQRSELVPESLERHSFFARKSSAWPRLAASKIAWSCGIARD